MKIHHVLLFYIILLGCAGAIFYWLWNSSPQRQWQTYTSVDQQYTMRYPPNWSVEDDASVTLGETSGTVNFFSPNSSTSSPVSEWPYTKVSIVQYPNPNNYAPLDWYNTNANLYNSHYPIAGAVTVLTTVSGREAIKVSLPDSATTRGIYYFIDNNGQITALTLEQNSPFFEALPVADFQTMVNSFTFSE